MVTKLKFIYQKVRTTYTIKCFIKQVRINTQGMNNSYLTTLSKKK